jgi:DNA polymerase-3 subunit epsilon
VGLFDGLRGSGKKKELDVDTWTGGVDAKIEIDRCPYVVFDMEMTGLNLKKDFIVSIGGVKMTGGKIHASEKFYTLVKPPVNLEKENVVIHRITPDELVDQAPIDEVLPRFLEFIKDSVLVGHYVHFDLGFLNKFMKQIYGKKLKNPAMDTHNLHEWLLQNDSGFRQHYRGGSVKTDLFSLAKRYNIEVNEAHNALIDSYITAQLFQRFIHFYRGNDIFTLKSLMSIGRA